MRAITASEERALVAMYQAKAAFGHLTGYCTTALPLEMHKWNGIHPVEQNVTLVTIPADTPLKIVMVSRFGDIGLTDDLQAEYGYHVRVMPEDDRIRDIRLSQHPTEVV